MPSSRQNEIDTPATAEQELRYFWNISAEFRRLIRDNKACDDLNSCVDDLKMIQLHTKQFHLKKQCAELIEEFEVRTSPLAKLPSPQVS